MKLQYQLSNGAWADCADRTQEFIDNCVSIEKNGGIDSVIKTLESGKSVQHDFGYWHCYCRDADSLIKQKITEIKHTHCCSKCGQTGNSGKYPFSTLVGSGLCDDCL
jgi:hypothetical protein